MYSSRWREFADKSPGNFRALAIIIVHKKPVTKFGFHFHPNGFCSGRNSVCATDCLVRFEERETVLEFHIESIFPLEIPGVFHRAENAFTERHF
jgi:hypothetical protein